MPFTQFNRTLEAAVGYFELGMAEEALAEIVRIDATLATTRRDELKSRARLKAIRPRPKLERP